MRYIANLYNAKIMKKETIIEAFFSAENENNSIRLFSISDDYKKTIVFSASDSSDCNKLKELLNNCIYDIALDKDVDYSIIDVVYKSELI